MRLGYALFGTGNLGGIAGQEVIHCLRRRELGNRRHDAKCICRQHDDIARMRCKSRSRGIGNEVERIGTTGVFGQRTVVKVRHTTLIENDIFENSAKALSSCENLRLGLGRQPDGLCVAATLKVEDAVSAPAMLIVTDQGAGRVGRQGGLASA